MLQVDAHGVPLSLVVTGANRHDVTQLEPLLDSIVVPRPAVTPPQAPQHLCADAALPANRPQAIRQRHDIPHVRGRGEEHHQRARGTKPRRWVVEVAHSWFNRFRKLLVRYEQTHRAFVALNMPAAAIICFRKVPAKINIIYG